MRLLDQVCQASAAFDVVDGTGRHTMPGPGAYAEALTACPLRFVLDAAATRACDIDAARLIRQAAAIRMPAPSFWVEWPEVDGRRTGALVSASDCGRKGMMELFWEQPADEPDQAQAVLLFDLSDAAVPLRGGGPFGADPLAPLLSLRVAPCWARHWSHAGAALGDLAVRTVATDLARAAEVLFAFALVMGRAGLASTSTVDRSRLNLVRRRAGKPALLDHVEVHMNLDQRAERDARVASLRDAARLHQVRGHFVRRGGRVFWRRPHLRGEPIAPPPIRTVNVGHAR